MFSIAHLPAANAQANLDLRERFQNSKAKELEVYTEYKKLSYEKAQLQSEKNKEITALSEEKRRKEAEWDAKVDLHKQRLEELRAACKKAHEEREALEAEWKKND